jgi:hypothetical protein
MITVDSEEQADTLIHTSHGMTIYSTLKQMIYTVLTDL